jgi:hypothetical protein
MALILAGMLMLSAATEDVEALAAQAGVDVMDLQGAAHTTGLEPREYLYMTGELQRPFTPTVRAPSSVWDRLAACESGGRWNTNTGNGFYGGLQFTLGTWRAYGGTGMPHLASKGQQVAVAERVLRRQGWRAWPTCARRLGLR